MKHDERTLETAAEWFDRLRHEDLSPEAVASWQRWIAEDPAHRSAFDSLQEAWQRFEGVPMPALPTAAERMTDEYTGEVPVSEWAARRRTSGWTRRLTRPFSLAAALGVLLIGAGTVWHLMDRSDSTVVSAFETHAAEHRDVRLPDGSAVSIGAKSLVWIRFQPGLREIVLDRGEAYFEVAKDPRRPFVVRVDSAAITAVGTAFNVRKTGTRVQVVVTEGAVNVSADASTSTVGSESARLQPVRLQAGKRWTGDLTARVVSVSHALPDTAAAWRAGRLEYVGEPLRYVVADVSRYSTMDIVIADPQLGDVPVTGTVFEEDIDGWLESLPAFIPVRVERVGGDRVVLHSTGSPARAPGEGFHPP
jgi:transmembrane sensor